MPLITKILFVVVALGMLAVPIAIAHFQSRPPRRSRMPASRIEPIGNRRYNRLWVVDRDLLDNDKER